MSRCEAQNLSYTVLHKIHKTASVAPKAFLGEGGPLSTIHSTVLGGN